MKLPDNEILKKFYDLLNGNIGINVYTAVPKNQAYPYCVIYDQTTEEDSTKGQFMCECTILVEIIYADEGQGTQKEINTTANTAIGLLRVTTAGVMDTTNFKVVLSTLLPSPTITEETEESKIFRKLLRFRVLTEEK